MIPNQILCRNIASESCLVLEEGLAVLARTDEVLDYDAEYSQGC